MVSHPAWCLLAEIASIFCGGSSPMTSSAPSIDALRAEIQQAHKIVCVTGEGVGTALGIPDPRLEEPIWRRYRYRELASPAMFARDPEVVWEFHRWLRQRVEEIEPGAVHREIARFSSGRGALTLATLSVDGLHGAAGIVGAIELFGSLWRARCPGCGEVFLDRSIEGPVPECTGCGSLTRPDIVWFGESVDPGLFEDLLEAVRESAFLLLVGMIGSPALPARLVREAAIGGAGSLEIVESSIAAGIVPDDHRIVVGSPGEILGQILTDPIDGLRT